MAYTTIDDPSIYFNTILWTGSGNSSARSFTGVGFQPDWVWYKCRSDTYNHNFVDVVRGTGLNSELCSNKNSAEGGGDASTHGYLSSFDSDGFSSANGSSNNLEFNQSGDTFVAWNWKAGGSASSNSDGTITSSVSANTTAGFSIVSYTSNGSASQTVGHGLGAVPHMIIAKNRDSGGSSYNYWTVYHHSLATANDKKLKLNETEAATSTNLWGDADPTTTKFYVHTTGDGSTNVSTDKIIAYCFTGKKGYSKFGRYIGNGSSDGPFVYTGFKPAWVMFKPAGESADWTIVDAKRNTFNVVKDKTLNANLNSAEHDGSMDTDFLSNGFKIRNGNTDNNSSNAAGIIYMAFAESPFVNSSGVPTNAR